MSTARSIRVLAFAGATLLAAFGAGGVVSAQEDGTTSTTQLDLEDGDGSSTTTSEPESTTTTQLDLEGGDGSTTTTAPPESTTTTQLDLQQPAGDSATTTTQLQVGGDAVTTGGVAPPNRVDAGAGGAAAADGLPLAAVLLAAGLVVATGAGAVKVRRSQAGT